jgi:hypothetical protein
LVRCARRRHVAGGRRTRARTRETKILARLVQNSFSFHHGCGVVSHDRISASPPAAARVGVMGPGRAATRCDRGQRPRRVEVEDLEEQDAEADKCRVVDADLGERGLHTHTNPTHGERRNEPGTSHCCPSRRSRRWQSPRTRPKRIQSRRSTSTRPRIPRPQRATACRFAARFRGYGPRHLGLSSPWVGDTHTAYPPW